MITTYFLPRAHMDLGSQVYVDTTGTIRIPHETSIMLKPCKCRLRIGQPCCAKDYCSCRKAGFYCGPSCKCWGRSCCNRHHSQENTQINETQTQASIPEDTPDQKQPDSEALDKLEQETLILDFDYDAIMKLPFKY